MWRCGFLTILIALVQNTNFCKCNIPIFLRALYCKTSECETYGLKISNNLNKNINPCENFYKFTCDGWAQKTTKPDSEVVWNHWQDSTQKINNRIHDILESNISSPNLDITKQIYHACKKRSNFDEANVNLLKLIIKNLGHWPLVHGDETLANFQWFKQITKIIKMFGVYPILKIHTDIDYKNTSYYNLYIEPGNLVFPSYILTNPTKYPKELNAYKLWIFETIQYLYPNSKKHFVESEVVRIIQFEIRLAKLVDRSKNERITFENLSYKYAYNFLKDFETFFDEKKGHVTENCTIIIKNHLYFKNVFKLVQKIDQRVIANYIMWTLVKELSRDTSKYLRHLSFLVDSRVMGVKSDISKHTECLSMINKYFHTAITPIYTKKYIHPKTFAYVAKMIKNIKKEFLKIIENSWLGNDTKFLAVEKIKNLKQFIGYPRNEDCDIFEYFKNVNVTENNFINMLNVKGYLTKKQILKYNTKVEKIEWPSSSLDVNAYYSILQNSIFIPLGILEPPFFYINMPDFINYGSLGSLIGHEISHSLDMSGRQADKNGNIKKWWSDENVLKYQKRAKCYQNYYNDLNIDGALTIGENIADNIGLQISFLAYKNLKKSKLNLRIPSLDQFTPKQLFFVTFSQLWCEIIEQTDLFLDDVHAPVETRVLGTLSNSKYFIDAFKCSKKVDGKDFCKLWS